MNESRLAVKKDWEVNWWGSVKNFNDCYSSRSGVYHGKIAFIFIQL
jgi:hypothetical protein